jgi:hypothetical protein
VGATTTGTVVDDLIRVKTYCLGAPGQSSRTVSRSTTVPSALLSSSTSFILPIKPGGGCTVTFPSCAVSIRRSPDFICWPGDTVVPVGTPATVKFIPSNAPRSEALSGIVSAAPLST